MSTSLCAAIALALVVCLTTPNRATENRLTPA